MAAPRDAEPDTALAPIGDVHRTQSGRDATEPMRADIRLLGGILGDTIREQNGEAVFDLVERARTEAFRVRRSAALGCAGLFSFASSFSACESPASD